MSNCQRCGGKIILDSSDLIFPPEWKCLQCGRPTYKKSNEEVLALIGITDGRRHRDLLLFEEEVA